MNHKPAFEALEGRLLLHSPTFSAVTADNRGEAFITVAADAKDDLDLSTITSAAFQMFTAGTDGVLGTTDDVKIHAALNYNQTIGRITMRGAIPADHSYRVRVVASRFRSATNDLLDGEFHGAQTLTGNGIPGGNFEIQVRRDTSTRPTARFSTSAGTMNVSLFKSQTPLNVSNFLAYANTGRYDNIFFTRAEAGFVNQGGGLRINGSNSVVDNVPFQKGNPPHDVTVPGEPGISNTRGRLSFALTGSNVSGQSQNNGTNEFFFNVADNSFLDVESGNAQQGFSGPFTAFGECRGANDLATMDAINGKPTIDFASLNPPLSFSGTVTNKVPVNNAQQAQAGLNPNRDLIVIRRVSVIARIFAL